MLRRIAASDIPRPIAGSVDAQTLATAQGILDDVRAGGVDAVRSHAERLGDLRSGEPLFRSLAECEAALRSLDPSSRGVLERTAERIRAFAIAQREALTEVRVPVPGGSAGHRVRAVEAAGCYAPGGRYPLPSSVLMTAVTARVAGVDSVWLASPKPSAETLAAAAIAGVDGVLAVGGVQAIGALAFGLDGGPQASDAVVGPGNRWVTAAKQLVGGTVAIDMLAGPSELVVIADGSSDASLIASDLLAQAEHDEDARAILIATNAGIADAVNEAIRVQLEDLPTRETASRALANGFCVVVDGIDEAIETSDRIAPEHLEIHTESPREVADRCAHYGGVFIGASSAEVLGDYGAGPNHTLPTGGTARSFAGLSVLTFLRAQTWLEVSPCEETSELASDAEQLAMMEGLHGHARSAARRR